MMSADDNVRVKAKQPIWAVLLFWISDQLRENRLVSLA